MLSCICLCAPLDAAAHIRMPLHPYYVFRYVLLILDWIVQDETGSPSQPGDYAQLSLRKIVVNDPSSMYEAGSSASEGRNERRAKNEVAIRDKSVFGFPLMHP